MQQYFIFGFMYQPHNNHLILRILDSKFALFTCSYPYHAYTQILRHRISQGRTFFEKPHIRCKNGLFESIFHQFQAKIATFHPLWMSFGISYQI